MDSKIETNIGNFTVILGVQVVSVYSYIEPTTNYCICAWQRIVMLYLLIRKIEFSHFYASLKLFFSTVHDFYNLVFVILLIDQRNGFTATFIL